MPLPTQQPVHSMTGAGVARGTTELGEIAVELRSVNGRNLGIKTRCPSSCQAYETDIEARIRKRLRRGQVRVAVEVVAPPPIAESIVDQDRATAAAAQLADLANRLQLSTGPTLADVLNVPGVLATTGNTPTRVSRELPTDFAQLIDSALDQLLESRAREGAATTEAVLEQIDHLEQDHRSAAKRAPAVVDSHREKLMRRVNEFLEGKARALEDSDVLREVAMFADRVDVEEELQRISAHLKEARELLARGGELGRKLEFLLQETLREINTLGSKSPDVEMASTVISMKANVDKIREQSANLE